MTPEQEPIERDAALSISEDVPTRWPVMPEDDADVASRVFEAFRRQHPRGEEPSVRADDERFPSENNSVADLFRQNAILRSLAGASASGGGVLQLPAVGDELFGFRLQHELGRGAFACVFLAQQDELAGRPVVLKVSAIEGDEPQTLAQLQHTHIVPIYSVHEDERAGLRAVCMPYFGGASLSAVLRQAWQDVKLPTRGDALTRALEIVGGPRVMSSGQCPVGRKPPRSVTGPAAELLPTLVVPLDGVRVSSESSSSVGPSASPDGPPPTAHCPLPTAHYSYVRAAVWIVARLAEALAHAHRRDVLHRDIKPSNILLCSDGQPMLLDFNLAHQMNSPQAMASATLGGTVAYMAPEHLRALASRDAALAGLVDERSDLYSLGMVLYEMLTGRRPFDQSASYSPMPALIEAMAVERGKSAPSLRAARRDIPWGLESIARKCLDPDPRRRYQRAEQLSEDLNCFLEDRPLKHAPELSQVERLCKWGRRHPRLATTGPVVAAASGLLMTVGAALFGAHENLANTRADLSNTREGLEVAQSVQRRQEFEADAVEALCLVNTTNDYLRPGLALCEKTLAMYGVLDNDDWQNHADWQRLAQDDRQRLGEDVRELLLLLARGRVRLARREAASLRQALVLLDRAAAVGDLRPSRELWEDRATYLKELGDATAAAARERADQLEPVSALDHYQLALTYAAQGGRASLLRAVTELNEALRLNPRHYWSWMQRGFCYQELGESTLATGDLGTCVGLRPEFAWGYYNRGYLLFQIGKRQEAIADFTSALERDARLAPAFLNRGLARIALKDHAAALGDFDRATELGLEDAFLSTGRAMALQGLGRFAEADAAFDVALTLARAEMDARKIRLLWVYGMAVCERLPEPARRAFDEVLHRHPGNPQALYGRALLAARAAEVLQALPVANSGLLCAAARQEALRFLEYTVRADPGLIEARRYRAIVRARCGQLAGAEEDINWCLDREPQSGATFYATACVFARAAEQAGQPTNARVLADQALDFLRKALLQGHDRTSVAGDPDLAALRGDPRFTELLP